MELKKKIALIAAGSMVSAGALFAVVTTANAADTSSTPAATSPAADSGNMDANDPADANEANDPADANEANDPADANEANDPADANEANDPADANDGSEASGK
jgi:hypothetical protein